MSEKKPSAGGPAKQPEKSAAGPAKHPAPPPLVEFIMAPTDDRRATRTRLPGVGEVDFTLGPIPVRRIKPAKKDDAISLPEKAKPDPRGSVTLEPTALAGWIKSGCLRVARPTNSTTVTKPNHVTPGRHARPVIRSYSQPGKRTAENEKPEPKTVFFEILPQRALDWRTGA